MSRITSLTCITFILSCILLCSCSGKESVAKSEHKVPPRDSAPKVLTPCADGTVVYNNDYASIDASNTSQGYIMVSYSGDCPKVKVQITGSDQIPYTYLLIDRGAYTTFPLSAGNGAYTIQVLENVEGDSYLIALSQDIDVAIEDEFLPFLYPNQYVSFTAGSRRLSKGANWQRMLTAIWKSSRTSITMSSRISLMILQRRIVLLMDTCLTLMIRSSQGPASASTMLL